MQVELWGADGVVQHMRGREANERRRDVDKSELPF